MIEIRELARLGDADVEALSDILVDCVEGGASVSFLLPMTRDKARAFFRSVADGVARGERILFAAFDDAGLVGTAQLIVEQPENQPHRADVAKMLVRRRARRRGVGALLLAAVEDRARAAGKTLLVLDTVTGGEAERLYAKQGWQRCGEIPGYALLPDGTPASTTLYWKPL